MTVRRRSQHRYTPSRPLLAPGGGRRSLSNVGGAVETEGDPKVAAALAHALAVRAGEQDATLTHLFHAYPARMHPEIARRLVALTPSAKSILDPFCGSGTVLVEALVAGAHALGTDLSPLAVALSKVKTYRSTNAERKRLVSVAHAVAKDARSLLLEPIEAAAPVGESHWFWPHTLRELIALRERINAEPEGFIRDALRMLFSSIIVKVSHQASDSNANVRRKHIEPGATFSLFTRKSFELAHALAELARATPPDTPAATVALDDATKLSTIADGSVDVVITSPPYAANYDYVAHHERRYKWLDLDASAIVAGEIGAARWFKRSLDQGVSRFERELTQSIAAIARVLRPAPSSRAFILMADGAAHDTPLPADEAIARAAGAAGLSVLARAAQERPVFGPEATRAFSKRARKEHLIALGFDDG
jgi:16S rRNA G966 N2-methylase RsmD